jgi:hypothetical protein
VDEKLQVQALARSQPAFTMMPGMPERRTHVYAYHGTASLFATLNTVDGTAMSSLHRRPRAVEFRKFLAKIDAQVPSISRCFVRQRRGAEAEVGPQQVAAGDLVDREA